MSIFQPKNMQNQNGVFRGHWSGVCSAFFTTQGEHLKEQFPNTSGFSTRSIERFCKEHEIRRKGVVSDEALDALVERGVSQVRY